MEKGFTREDLIGQEGLLTEALAFWDSKEIAVQEKSVAQDHKPKPYSQKSLQNISGFLLLKVLVEELMGEKALFVARGVYSFKGRRYKPTWTVGSFIERSRLRFFLSTIFKDGRELKASFRPLQIMLERPPLPIFYHLSFSPPVNGPTSICCAHAIITIAHSPQHHLYNYPTSPSSVQRFYRRNLGRARLSATFRN